ncbi:hypothetical protein NKR23_g5447 [Pleurostoma richardsiae]|uniref:Phytanoyl-CoA dioxygenase n=1 Tax=Pleurostoma richardsiae TaxID=41990 RepID=A0AA38RU57_9PEZI|nr:hypothetical protein NKR23_g5447 [Pleurostoma richardsiae]
MTEEVCSVSASKKCTYKNGATLVIPGSHLRAGDPAPQTSKVTYTKIEPGSALFCLGSTYHGAGGNNQRDYFRQDQDEVLATSLEVARGLPDDIRKLAGYYTAVSGVGYVEDHEHPVAYLTKADNSIGELGEQTTRV